MKYFTVILLICFIACDAQIPKEKQEFSIDKTLENKFSEGPLPGVRGGAYKTYLDGVLVDSSNEDGIQYLYNAS
ncbi:MAG TPA: hypothetical protein PK977_12210, partial [Chitinophagaceae bacterium]|nr:hypothetical protein [Chitinophagaceae bacterium]